MKEVVYETMHQIIKSTTQLNPSTHWLFYSKYIFIGISIYQ